MENILQQLIDMVKTASPILWETLMRQTYSAAYAEIFFSILGISLAIVAMIIVLKKYKEMKAHQEEDKYWGDEDAYFPWFVVCGIIMCIGYIFGLCGLVDAIQKLYNPSYYAIQMIIQNLR